MTDFLDCIRPADEGEPIDEADRLKGAERGNGRMDSKQSGPTAPSIDDYHRYARHLKRLLGATIELAEMHGADTGDIQAELDKLHGARVSNEQ